MIRLMTEPFEVNARSDDEWQAAILGGFRSGAIGKRVAALWIENPRYTRFEFQECDSQWLSPCFPNFALS